MLIVVYTPPKGNSHRACAKILDYIHGSQNLDKKDIILLGDFNWNADERGGSGAEYIEEISSEYDLKQIIKCPTRIGPHSQPKIDLIFTYIGNIYKYGCLNSTMSDHYP